MTEIMYDAMLPGMARISTDSQIVRDLVKNSVSRKWIAARKSWYYPVTELDDLFNIFKLAGEQFNIDTKINDAYTYFKSKTELLKSLKAGDVSSCNFPEMDNFTAKLYDYQKSVVSQIFLMHKYLLALEVGMGKTIISLYAAMALHKVKGSKCLIVCESNQIHKPWVDKILSFCPGVKAHIVEGNAVQRKAKIHEGMADMESNWLWIMSYDTVRIEIENLPKTWDVIIMDEITKIKNVSSKASDAIQQLSSDYTIGLSATPITNTYYDLYGVFKIINPHVFSTKKNFTEHFLELDFFDKPKGLKKGMEETMNKKVYPWMVQLIKEEYDMAKPIHISTYPVPLTAAQKEKLDEIMLAIKNGDKSPFECQTILRQICNTVKVLEEYDDYELAQTTFKVGKLKELLHKFVKEGGKKVVVFSYFKQVVKLLEAELGKEYNVKVVTGETKKTCKYADIQDCYTCKDYKRCGSVKKHVFEFTEGDVEILLGTDSLSRAHDLWSSDTVINFDLPWNASDMKQRIGRIDRGKKNPASEYFVYNIVTLGTIEEKIIKKIERKEKEQGKVLPKYNVSLAKLGKTIKVV